MRHARLRAWAALALLVSALPARAVAPVPVTIGSSRDGTLHQLQKVVDRELGPAYLDVETGFIGARAGDPDPWMWTTVPGRAVELTLWHRKLGAVTLGWYREGGGAPVLDGIDSGLCFDRGRWHGVIDVLRLPPAVKRFGFYVVREPGGRAIDGDNAPATYFTNRLLNDVGPHGLGPLHAPYDGDPQMLVYDISRWRGPDTWLVACEYSDTGYRVGQADGESDNDFCDIVFAISGVGVTPTVSTTFGRLKALYR